MLTASGGLRKQSYTTLLPRSQPQHVRGNLSVWGENRPLENRGVSTENGRIETLTPISTRLNHARFLTREGEASWGEYLSRLGHGENPKLALV